ncbi:hypothetical protein ACHQM5_000327 [Ranunculus cassubicifolius]
MEDGAKVRLVRCPKCENLLPELPNVDVYQCGGCGAVLQAKKRPSSSAGSSEKSDDERVKAISGKLESKGGIEDLGENSEMADVEIRQRRIEFGVPNETVGNSRMENKVMNVEPEIGRVGNYRRPYRDSVDGQGNDNDVNRSQGKSVRTSMEKDVRASDPQIGGIASRSSRSGQIANWRSGERDGSAAYRRTPRAVAEDVRFSSTSSYTDEGTSNYQPSPYDPIAPLMNPNVVSGPDRVEHLEQDRAELLRKLEELNMIKDQLSRSRELGDNSKERLPLNGRATPPDPYVGRDAWFPEGSSRQHGPPMQNFPPDNLMQRPVYSNHGLEPMPLRNRHGVDMQNFYPPAMHPSSELPGYGDPFAPQMPGPNKPLHQYQQHHTRDYYSAQYMEMDQDFNAPYPANTFFHQPACSCVHCYNKHLHASAQVPPAVLHNKRFVEPPPNPMFYPVENRVAFSGRSYNARDANPLPVRREPQPLVRRQRDPNTEASNFVQSRPRRVVPVKRNERHCCPIAGGAPFIICQTCSELLPIPRKLLQMEKTYRKLRCGACSSIISLLFESKSIIASIPLEAEVLSPVVNDRVPKEDHSHSQGQADYHGGPYSSDYDSSGYNFQLTDTEPGFSDQRLNLSESEKMQGRASSCSTTSEDEDSPDTVIARRDVPNPAEQPLKVNVTPPFPRSPSRERTPSNQVGSKFEKGNKSKRINHEDMVPAKTSRQSSVKDAPGATEMDVSFNEYSTGALSQEYGEVPKDDHSRPSSKGSDSIFGLIKRGFRDGSKSHPSVEEDRSLVLVNGRHISEKIVKKAEKHAGTIHPGRYWYDYRAGFWGVMGAPCLGIIPPFIEEFNFPMPEHCAGGNTGVYVNGRELHNKDLDLLVSRGLPRDADRSYVIEISGKVFDGESGEELDNLGKLAPTVEKLKHGFGMRVPRVKT